MSLTEITEAVARQSEVREIADRLRLDRSEAVLSVADTARSVLLAALQAELGRPCLIVVPRPPDARDLVDEIACWHPRPGNVMLFPEYDVLPYEALDPDPQVVAERLTVLTQLLALDGDSQRADAPLIVASARAVADLLLDPGAFSIATIRLRVGDRLRLDELLHRLVDLGYKATPVVDAPGQFGRRGGILDVYPFVGQACRIELFGDEIETIRGFDPHTQRSTDKRDELVVPPTRDSAVQSVGVDRQPASLIDYLPDSALLVLVGQEAVSRAATELEHQLETLRLDWQAQKTAEADAPLPYLPWSVVSERMDRHTGPRLQVEHDQEQETLAFVHPPAYGGRVRDFVRDCVRLANDGRRVCVVTQQSERIEELLAEGEEGPSLPDNLDASLPLARRNAAGSIDLVHGQIRNGWSCASLGVTIFTDAEIFGFHKIRRQIRARRPVGRQSFLTELQPGELVVHVDHGIARFRGMLRLPVEAQGQRAEGADPAREREFLLLEYAEGGRLYVPADQADRVARYVGGGESEPKITRLGSGEWVRARTRARQAVLVIAHELLELYAVRESSEGYSFPADSPWQRELESAFPYVETVDQLRALDEVKEDMERPKPMDRLLVGDVGFGKTEIALRAAFKAVEAGKQVAVLVPTTVLAQQHLATFSERLAAFPITVEMLSRFRADREQRAVVQALKEGSVDICIGTHRLLQKDVAFKDLGLVVIDEEQRFGVSHKERLKALRREVDVLTLTATPIPRTMHMSLVGVRDMSMIETAPEDRQPIRTFVMERDPALVREAILRELDRGGQVYYVHNRVRSIEIEAARLQELVPEATFAIGHGQMPEEQLERVMIEFADGQHDVLVCTTIIESGLDIPSVNTLIVNDAHRFGLSQLYQLRGRVGRSAQRAYAYFMFQRDQALTEVAEKRLRTIFEATELGAGFRIALKDLEIRGAGNLLGSEQHGQISAVGFDLYTRLLAEAVGQLKQARATADGTSEGARRTFAPVGLPPLALHSSTSINLPLAAHLPPEYVADEATRLHLYQRLASVSNGEQLGEIVAELTDRFGPLPEPVQNLVYVISLRLTARAAAVTQIQALDHEIVVQFDRLPQLDLAKLARASGSPLRAGSNQLRLPRGRGSGWLVQLQNLVESLPRAG